MAVQISTFPIVGDTFLNKQNIELSLDISTFTFSYEKEGEIFPLDSGEDLFIRSLQDPRGVWSCDKENLIIDGQFSITNGKNLYGKNGVSPSDSQIGVVLRWGSKTSKNRGLIPVGEIKQDNERQEFGIHHQFESSFFNGQVSFALEFYIKKVGVIGKDESFLANVQGTILFNRHLFILKIDGAQPDFPVIYYNEKSDPLWKLYMNCTTPTEDKFDSNSVCIMLNRAHSDFKFIDPDNSSNYNPRMLKEVLSSAVSLFLEQLRSLTGDKQKLDYIKDADDDSDWEDECVAEVVKNFQYEPTNFNYDSPIETAISVRKFFDQKLNKI